MGFSLWRYTILAVLALSMAVAACGGASTADRAPERAAPSLVGTLGLSGSSEVAYVDVSVATVWREPRIARPLDRPSLGNPVDPRRWTSGLTVAQRRWLVGRVETQVLYATRVLVLARSGGWSRIVVPSQATPRSRRGYPGWLPTVQLTGSTSLERYRGGPVAVVTAKTAWLRETTGRKRLELSFGTRLPALATTAAGVLVATPRGDRLVIARKAVAVYASAAAIPKPAGAEIVRAAERFRGLRYLWGGTSAWGFDCSGLTYTVYRRFGIAIPRDADAQAARGRPVSPAELAPGDLVFFAGAGGRGPITHVAIYAGDGEIVESPNSSAAVRVVPLSSRKHEYAGARRYL